jgi:hypothetical protein
MRLIASATAAAMLITLVVPAGAATFGSSGLTKAAQEMSSIDLVAAKAKKKGKKKRGKKAGPKTYKFCVQTLSPMPWTKGTCSAKGANMEAARTVCQSQGNNGFAIRNYSKKTCK